MNFLIYHPLTKPSSWALDILNTTPSDVLDYVYKFKDLSFDSVCLGLQISDDPDNVMSCLVHFRYLLNKDITSRDLSIELINEITEYRLEEMIIMRSDVMREIIQLLKYRVDPPSSKLCIRIGELIRRDPIAKELLVDVWIECRWKICSELVFSIRDSSSAWKLLNQVNLDGKFNSTKIVERLSMISNYQKDIWFCFRTLLGSNESTLSYVINADLYFGNGIKSTIQTIEQFDLWEVVLRNEAASPIIEYALTNFTKIKSGKFQSKKSIRKWLIPLMSTSSLVAKFVCKEDLDRKLVTKSFFRNCNAIDLISDWINEENITSDIIHNLVCIAACDNESSALKAIKIIQTTQYFDMSFAHLLTMSHWGILLQSKFAKEFVQKTLIDNDFDISIVDILRTNSMVPYWKRSWNDDCWEVHNLTINTLSYAKFDHEFYQQTEDLIEYLSYDNWKVLLQNEIGFMFGYENIGYIIDIGLLHELFKSKFMSKEELDELALSTDALDYATDEEFAAIIYRDDAYDIDLHEAFQSRFEMCQEAMKIWFHPSRLQRFATANNMSVNDYLNIF